MNYLSGHNMTEQDVRLKECMTQIGVLTVFVCHAKWHMQQPQSWLIPAENQSTSRKKNTHVTAVNKAN